jgi:hypothetical protein
MTLTGVGLILVGAAPAFAIAVVLWVTNDMRSGALVRLDVAKLHDSSQRQIALLEEQITALKRERENDREEILRTLREATKAEFAVSSFLDRYEGHGAFAIDPPKEAP